MNEKDGAIPPAWTVEVNRLVRRAQVVKQNLPIPQGPVLVGTDVILKVANLLAFLKNGFIPTSVQKLPESIRNPALHTIPDCRE